MGFDQYHEPAHELSAESRTFARMMASLTEEAEAIDWYEQRMSVEKDDEAKAIIRAHKRKNLSISEWIWSFCCERNPSGALCFKTSFLKTATSRRTASKLKN